MNDPYEESIDEFFINTILPQLGWNLNPEILPTKHQCIKLEYRKANKNDNSPCTICLSDYDECQNLIVLDCQHYFHEKCIKSWLKKQTTCPVCRCSVRGPDVK